MRVLFCNKYNYPFSGTEAYLFGLMELLRSHGHEVALFSMADARGEATAYDRHFVPHIEFKADKNPWRKAQGAAHAIYSAEARRRIRAMIEAFQPDVAHVRNIYHHLSPSILWELKRQRVPVLYHLNDFKLLCPSYNLVSEGKACEACKGGAFSRALATPCYPGTCARTVLVAEAYVHKWIGTYQKCVDRFLAPSQFVQDKFVEHGWGAERFEVLQHFQEIRPIEPLRENAPLLYFGRLSPEKGVADLLRAMQRVPHRQLAIAGDGPQRVELVEQARTLGLTNVEFKGHLHGAELEALIAASCCTILPSHAYETFGKTIVESYAHGRPVIASDLGSRRELVRHGETGLLFPEGDIQQLADAIEELSARADLAEKMGHAGWKMVKERHTPEAHYDALVNLYKRLKAPAMRTEQSPVASSLKRHGARLKSYLSVVKASDAKLPVKTERPKLRIAFIGGRGVGSKYSGIETYYEEIGKRLAKMGHEVTIYCRNYFTPPQAEHYGMRLIRLPTIRSKHLETLIHTALSTLHVLTRRCDVVHYHTLGPALFSFIPRLFGKKTAVTVQGLDWQRKKWGPLAGAVLRLGERASAQLPNGTMVVSQTLQQHYRRRHGIDALYVPNGGVLREQSAPRKILEWGLQSKKYVLFLGRFSPEKGCHLLIEAYKQLDTDVKLVMAGPSSYCDQYSRELRSHAGEKILLLDPVSGETLDELLSNAMIFVLPSDLEGLSLALLDAMGAGLCVLASDVPENREVVHEAGFTFQRGNAVDLAQQLRFLIENPHAREVAGKAAKTRVLDRYLWPEIAVEIERAYFELLDHKNQMGRAKKPSLRIIQAAVDSAEQPKARTG